MLISTKKLLKFMEKNETQEKKMKLWRKKIKTDEKS